MKEKNKIRAIILAAGESSRMGQPKMLLPFRGKTMIECVIANLMDAGIGNIIVVTGAHKEELSILLQKLSVNFCINNNYSEGMLSSVICGIRNLPDDTSAIIVIPGDQPLISPSTTEKLVNSYLSSDYGIFIPVFNGRRGHPVLISDRYIAEIEMLKKEQGLRSLASLHSGDVHEVVTDDPGILKDFDTYDEYLNEINQIS